MSDRTPCLNPRCGRTFKAEDGVDTVVCGKCWKLLPQSWRARDKQLRKRWRLVDRIAAKGDGFRQRGRKFGAPGKGMPQSYTMRVKLERIWHSHWSRIKAFYLTPDKPAGLETFLEEIGL
ncbi:hypothetical protein [Mesorhizobium sp.]|uniref:hypothetical protein n=1 Tax=Mesorhizobium sp. TaxID=1871066 RepID=UPI000FE98168|nr:hypothetical protein [Mesorhizobium sp.]RWN35825.1 MAG: hypothetical protein EOR95_12570 [Mesorhizobium sp.]